MPTNTQRIAALEQALADLSAYVEELQSQLWELQGRCPGCGEPLDDDHVDDASLAYVN
jgi:hypothetical protein